MTKARKIWSASRLDDDGIRRKCYEYSHSHRLLSGLNADDTQSIKDKRMMLTTYDMLCCSSRRSS